MSNQFVITEFFRKPDEDYGDRKIWFYKNTLNKKREISIFENGSIVDIFFDEKQYIHRDFHQPSFISNNVIKYYVHGKLHRGHFEPAVIHSSGEKEYWVFGEKRFSSVSLSKDNSFSKS